MITGPSNKFLPHFLLGLYSILDLTIEITTKNICIQEGQFKADVHCETMCFMIDLVKICDENSAVGAVFPPQYLNYSPQRLTNFLCQIFII